MNILERKYEIYNNCDVLKKTMFKLNHNNKIYLRELCVIFCHSNKCIYIEENAIFLFKRIFCVSNFRFYPHDTYVLKNYMCDFTE